MATSPEFPTAPYPKLRRWALRLRRVDGSTHEQVFIRELSAIERCDRINEALACFGIQDVQATVVEIASPPAKGG